MITKKINFLTKSEELDDVLRNISDTYDDFVRGISELCKSDEERQSVIDYVKNNSDVDTSDVIDFCEDEIYSKR